MKKSFVIMLIVLTAFKVQAQDYMISFAGTGDTTVVNSVKVVN